MLLFLNGNLPKNIKIEHNYREIKFDDLKDKEKVRKLIKEIEKIANRKK